MTRALAGLLMLSIVGNLLAWRERPSRPVTYTVKAECFPEPKRERPKTRLV